MKLFISPHNDDETLFGAFTIIREKPAVLIVTDSARQASRGITAEERRRESGNAMQVLGASSLHFLGIPDAELEVSSFYYHLKAFLDRCDPFEHIYFPAWECEGNRDHNLISTVACKATLQDQSTSQYLTYTKVGKSRSQNEVPVEKEWPLLKLQALACYRSQILEPSTRDHFLRDQFEYYA